MSNLHLPEQLCGKLPSDVCKDIILRLPVKSLLRFRSVSKTWCKFLSSPRFLYEHLKFTKSLNSTQFLVEYHTPDEEMKRQLTKHYVIFSDDNKNTLEEVARIDFTEPSLVNYLDIIGSCNGVVCLPVRCISSESRYDGEEVVILWNPSIRRSLHLPRSKSIITSINRTCIFVFGFVYDNANDDYKVLRAINTQGVDPFYEGHIQKIKRIEIYKLSTGLWEDITHKAPFIQGIFWKSQADLNGVAHWFGISNREFILVAFDIHEESFRSVRLPNVGLELYTSPRLLVFEEKLFFFCRLRYEDEHNEEKGYYDVEKLGFRMKYGIWRMEEYGDSESWNQLHIGDYYMEARPLGFRKNGDVIWAAVDLGLVSNTIGEYRFTVLKDFDDVSIHLSGSSYRESLALLDKTDPSRGDEDVLGICYTGPSSSSAHSQQ